MNKDLEKLQEAFDNVLTEHHHGAMDQLILNWSVDELLNHAKKADPKLYKDLETLLIGKSAKSLGWPPKHPSSNINLRSVLDTGAKEQQKSLGQMGVGLPIRKMGKK